MFYDSYVYVLCAINSMAKMIIFLHDLIFKEKNVHKVRRETKKYWLLDIPRFEFYIDI